MTSSLNVFGRHACLSEEVTFTCTAQGHVIFWGNEAFGEITVHYLSPPSRGNFRAVVESYDSNRNCLVSSLTLRATASRNRTRVMCTSRDRSLSESLSLHIMSMLLFFVRARNCFVSRHCVLVVCLVFLSSCSFCLQECESCIPINFIDGMK